ncbi:MAG: hypothetical protein IJP92_15245 [Lachnospiraceae bacterium]|nr:hypothetical protein [Lachnospiraceae bacterium]
MRKNGKDYREQIREHLLKNEVSFTITAPRMEYAQCMLRTIPELLLTDQTVQRVIILAAKRSVENVWLPLFRHDPQLALLSYVPALGKQQKKLRACSIGKKVILTNDESLEWMKGVRIGEHDMLVIDDLARYRRLCSARYRIVKGLCARAGRIAAFSRLPLPHGMSEVWEELYLLDGGKCLGRTKQAFLDRYFFVNRIWTNGRMKQYAEPKVGADQAISRAIGEICLDLSHKEENNDAEPNKRNFYIDLSRSELSRYRLMSQVLSSEMARMERTAMDQSVLAGKLLQMASGGVYSDQREVIRFHERKINALKMLRKEFPEQNLLVAYWFKHELDHIAEAIPCAKAICDRDSIDQWNDGRVRVGLVNSAAGGTPHDLSQGGNILVWFSLTWSLQLYTKCCGRIQPKSGNMPTVIHLVARETIDETVLKMIETKRKDNRLLLAALAEGAKKK